MLTKIINRRLLAHRSTLYFFSKGTLSFMQIPSTNLIARKMPSVMTSPSSKKPRSLSHTIMRKAQEVDLRKNIRHLHNHRNTSKNNRKENSTQQDFKDSVVGHEKVSNQRWNRKENPHTQRKAISLQRIMKKSGKKNHLMSMRNEMSK